MAYASANLWPIGNADGNSIWYYKTVDTPLTVDTAGYFTSEAVGMLKVGDVVLVVQVNSVSNPTAVTAAGWHIVLSNDGTTVDVSDATALAVTDLD